MRRFSTIDGRWFRQRRYPLASLTEAKIMAWHMVCSHRGRECCGGWQTPQYDGDITVFAANPRGGLIEVRVIKAGYISAILRGAEARRFDEAL